VAKNAGWDTLGEGVTVDFWVKVLESSGTVRLFTLQGGLLVYLTQGNRLTAALIDGANVRVELAGPAITAGQWVHVAMRFDSADRSLQLYVDGSRVATRVVSGFGALRTTGAVRVGPDASSALLLMDEVKVSNVARSPTEIGHNANVVTHQAPDPDLVAAIPAHLRPLRFAASGVDRFSPAAAELGRSLFEDVILSRQRTTSCATCHRPGQAFTDGRAISRGNEPTDAGVRNSPTLLNRLFSSLQGWSGQATSLDRQALIPIAAAHELNLPINQAVQRLVAHPGYAARFQAVYGQAPSAETLAAALGSFQAIQFAPANRVDAYRGGDRARLTASEVRGLDLFEGKARCSGCHAGQNYTDESFRNNGLTTDADPGRAEITGRNRDFRLFKVPTLRELASTAPYMHDGSLATLLEVVASYNEGGLGDPMADSDIRPLELSNEEMRDLEAFLKALSGAPAPAFKDGFEAR